MPNNLSETGLPLASHIDAMADRSMASAPDQNEWKRLSSTAIHHAEPQQPIHTDDHSSVDRVRG